MENLKIATFNVNGIGAPLGNLLRWLEREQPDIVSIGNLQPGLKFDYKLRWFEHLIEHAKSLQASAHLVVLAGDFNVVPTDEDNQSTRSLPKGALLQPESHECYSRLQPQGWLDSLRHLYPDERIYTFWDYFRQHWQKNSGLRIDHLLLNPVPALHLEDAGADAWVRNEEHPSDPAPTWIRLGNLQ